MTAAETILLQAAVGPGEATAVAHAADLLASALGEGASVRVAFPESLETIDRAVDPCIVLTSLLEMAGDPDEPWTACEDRLRRHYEGLTRDPRVSVFVLTILRHVRNEEGGIDRSRLNRIRRLNLLAAELSRETGVYVIDIDRALADIGAAVIGADHRLGGSHAAEAAGRCIASVVLSASLDGVIAFERSQAAAAVLAALPVIGAGAMAPRAPPVLVGPERRQYAARRPSRLPGAEGRLRDLLAGRASIGEAMFLLRRAIAHRGPAESLALILDAVRRMAGPRARTAR